jgi:alpha-tubulin suppressor-like RCC1 family protein
MPRHTQYQPDRLLVFCLTWAGLFSGCPATISVNTDASTPSSDGSVVVPLPDSGDVADASGAVGDAGSPVADSGQVDAGINSDAGTGDAGLPADAGPIPVTLVSVDVKTHACASNSLGHVFCWGQHGIDRIKSVFPESLVPLQVPGIADATTVAHSESSACALTRTGGVKCWGDNSLGQLGNGTLVGSATPVEVLGITGAKTLSGTCVITSQDTVQCWGRGIYGELGNGKTTASAVPVDVVQLGTVKYLTGGTSFLNCAVTSQDTVKCWGLNADGILGGTSAMSVPTPTPVELPQSLTDVAAVHIGASALCARSKAGVLACWGKYNDHGILGNGSTTASLTPMVPRGLGPVTRSAMGPRTACAVDGTGLKCWGQALFDQPGYSDELEPTVVNGLGSVEVHSLAIGYNSICAIVGGTTLKCWGANDQGQLANGTGTPSRVPIDVLGVDK